MKTSRLYKPDIVIEKISVPKLKRIPVPFTPESPAWPRFEAIRKKNAEKARLMREAKKTKNKELEELAQEAIDKQLLKQAMKTLGI